MANIDWDLAQLLELGDRIVAMATKGGGTVAECILRSRRRALGARCASASPSSSKRRRTAAPGCAS